MGYKEQFENLQLDFYRWMVKYGKIKPGTSRTYISKIRFLSEFYLLDSTITEDYIEEILSKESIRRLERVNYSGIGAINDFQAVLRKFKNYISSDYYKKLDGDHVFAEIDEIESSSMLSTTQKEVLKQARIGQGDFRQKLMEYWGGCSVTGYKGKDVLIASHIKPWRDSDNRERLDVFNGLLLLPNYDKLFDRGYLTFRPDGKVEYSKVLSQDDKLLLGLKDDAELKQIDERHKIYLKYHNDYCFVG